MKTDWELTQEEFNRLLAWLDPDKEKAGQQFLAICERLTKIIASRGCPEADVIFYEAARRIARKPPALFAEYDGEPIRYFYSVAINVYREWRAQQPEFVELPAALSTANHENEEAQFECLEQCLRQLNVQDRELFVRYHQGEKQAKIDGRKALAKEFHLTDNALKLRIHRLKKTMFDYYIKFLGQNNLK
jgi:DNA-directed RNA polymerase specialized sigma24 family protein